MTQQLLPCVEINPAATPDACVIWLHGLGDSGHGFAPIVPELRLPDSMAVKFIFPMPRSDLSPSIMVCACERGMTLSHSTLTVVPI